MHSSPRREVAHRHNSPSEKPFADHNRVAGTDGVIEFYVELFFAAVHDAYDLDSAGRATIGDAAGKRERLQHAGVLLLETIGAGIFHLPEHVNAFRARHED